MLKCNVCGEKVREREVFKKPMAVFMFYSTEETCMVAMCPDCSVNVSLYIQDLTRDFSMLPKPRKVKNENPLQQRKRRTKTNPS